MFRAIVSPLVLALGLAGCSSAAVEPPIKLAPETNELTAVVLFDGAGTLTASIFDLTATPSPEVTPPEDFHGPLRTRILYYYDPIDTFGVAPGPLKLVALGVPGSRALPPFPRGQEQTHKIGGTVSAWTGITSVEAIYYAIPIPTVGNLTLSLRSWGAVVALPNVEVCTQDGSPQNCATSSADGRVKLDGLPTNEPIVLLLREASRVPTSLTVYLTQASTTLAGNIFLMTPDDLGLIARVAGVTLDQVGAGQVDLEAFSGQFATDPVSDIAATLNPMSGASFPTGGGVDILNAQPGDYEVKIATPRMFCGISGGGAHWLAEDGRTPKIRVIAGFVTQLQSISCSSS